MLDKVDWNKYGVVNGVARDPRCENCMVHCGYDPSGALGTNYQPGDNWKNFKYNFCAPAKAFRRRAAKSMRSTAFPSAKATWRRPRPPSITGPPGAKSAFQHDDNNGGGNGAAAMATLPSGMSCWRKCAGSADEQG